MAFFQILDRPSIGNDPQNQSAPFVVAEKFSWFAALLPPIWALSHKMWLETLAWLGCVALIALTSLFLGDIAFDLYVLFAVWTGFEAQNLRIKALQRKGYRTSGTIIAASADLAEMTWIARAVQQDMNAGAKA